MGRNGYGTARTIDQLVNGFLLANDPFPVGTAVFAARWQPGQGLASVVSRNDMDEWAVAFIDGSGKVVRDHVELCPARSDRPSKCSGLGAVFASHPQFDQVAIKPVKTITEKCGRQYAYDVIVHSGVVDATWTALTDVADNPQHY